MLSARRMGSLRQDLRHAVRSLLRHKSIAAAAVLTLALGLGVGTALYSVVDGVLLRPLPYPESEQLVRVFEQHPDAKPILQGQMLSDVTLDAWTDMRTLEGIGRYSHRTFTWSTPEGAIRVEGGALAPALPRLLRVAPHRGRFFNDSEGEAGADQVVVLGYDLWVERFGARDAAVGEYIRLDDKEHLIIGVAPPRFAFPSPETRLWTPFARPVREPGSVYVSEAIGRLRPGATPEQVEIEGTAVARSVARPMVTEMLFGRGGRPVEVRAVRLLDHVTAGVRPALTALGAGVLLVLCIACANVANLLLTYGLARRRELAVRAALGAPSGRLIRLLLLESLVLALAGVGLGLVFAWFVIDAVPALVPESVPRLENVSMNARVVFAGMAAAFAAALVSGLVPAWRSSRVDLALAQRDDDGRSAGLASTRLRFVLLVGEAALALVLIVGAGLLVRSVNALVGVDSGYDPSNVLVARVVVAGERVERARTRLLADRVTERVRALPGVVAAGVGNMVPFGGATMMTAHTLDRPGPGGEPVVAQAASNIVTPGFLEALRIRLVDGRTFERTDAALGNAMLVNETFARQYLNDGAPVVGRRFPVAVRDGEPSWTIVGVVGDVRPSGPRTDVRPEIFYVNGPARQVGAWIQVAVRTTGDPAAVIAPLREIVRTEDPLAAVDEAGPLSANLARSIAQPRFFATVLSLFAALALVLAAVGLYGVLSYIVTLRRRELGVRAALGARRADLLRMVVRQGLGATAAGLVAGLVLAIWAARLMRTLLFGIEPLDVPSFVAGAAVLLAVALLASLIPARRAASSDPLEALRHQ